jgi:hypothetical protein
VLVDATFDHGDGLTPQGRQIAPRTDKGNLDRILGSTEVTQNSEGNGQSGSPATIQAGEGILIASDGELDERRLHVCPSIGPGWGRYTPMGSGRAEWFKWARRRSGD